MLNIDYTFTTQSGYCGCGLVQVPRNATVDAIRVTCFRDAYANGFRNLVSVRW